MADAEHLIEVYGASTYGGSGYNVVRMAGGSRVFGDFVATGGSVLDAYGSGRILNGSYFGANRTPADS